MPLYKLIITVVDRFVPPIARPFWESPAGPKTIFFWAPLIKWGLVIAGISDTLNRKPDRISLAQTGVISFSGMIWTRYSFVITPINYNLALVNASVAIIQGNEFRRAYKHQQQFKKE